MEYRQIDVGPFCGLFAWHLNEYELFAEQEVIDQLQRAETLLLKSEAKRFFVLDGLTPKPDTDFDKIESLVKLIVSRGYKILLRHTGNVYPRHAKDAHFIEVIIPETGVWLQSPCTSVIFDIGASDKFTEPRFLPHHMNIPKYVRINASNFEKNASTLMLSDYPWVIQFPTKRRVLKV